MTQGLPYWMHIKSPLDRAMRQSDAEANVSAACYSEPQGEEQHNCDDATKDESASLWCRHEVSFVSCPSEAVTHADTILDMPGDLLVQSKRGGEKVSFALPNGQQLANAGTNQ